MKVDSGLCQPAGTPIPTQTGCRLRVTFVHVKTDVLSPVHVCVERRIALLTHVQPAFNALTVIFLTADTTRLTRVAFRNFYDVDTPDHRPVHKYLDEVVSITAGE